MTCQTGPENKYKYIDRAIVASCYARVISVLFWIYIICALHEAQTTLSIYLPGPSPAQEGLLLGDPPKPELYCFSPQSQLFQLPSSSSLNCFSSKILYSILNPSQRFKSTFTTAQIRVLWNSNLKSRAYRPYSSPFASSCSSFFIWLGVRPCL